jgi:diphosphomevalonate decarboxylase
MHNHPFSKERYRQANQNLKELVAILKSGDLEKFILLTESEALTLHAMMMTSNPYFILMKEGTLSTIEKIWDFRTNSKIPLSFTLDAGANVHLLYPKDYQQSVMNFINSDLIVFCENQQYICDEVGSGAKILNESYA